MNTKRFGLKSATRVRCCTALTALMCCGLLAVTHAQTNYQRLKSFGFPDLSSGGDPASPLLLGNDGMLYGTTFREGSSLPGTVFRLETNGSRFEVLYRFTTNGGHGYGPQAGLIQGTDGTLYGTTAFGGAGGAGTVFRLGTNGGGYTEFYAFSSSGADGSSPHAGLVLGSDGVLYGTAVFGGSGLGGTVFKVNTDGTGFTVLHNFVFAGADGINPNSILFQGSDGTLYGTTAAGGLNSGGTIFKLNQNGGGFAVLHAFAGGTDGRYPQGGVVEGSDGALYGTTKFGGRNDLGTVFKVNKSGSFYNVLHIFSNSAGDGNSPGARMLKTSTEGEIYGTTEGGGSGLGTLFKLNNDGSAFTVLYNFTGGQSAPVGVVLGRNGGVFYGTRYYDGVTGGGTVFKLSTDGSNHSILHAFDLRGGDGEDPAGRLVQGNDGAIYGTTYNGGTNGAGTVFKVNPTDGSTALLWHFDGNAGDGQGPLDGLLQGSDGALYGTTIFGGSYGWGTLFKLNTNGGGFIVLHDFTYADGGTPRGGLIEGSDGWLYGATAGSGIGSGFDAAGFKIRKAGTDLTALRNFAGSVIPETLVQGTNGVLYGTTFLGGANGAGSLFSLTTNGDSYADLHSFDPGAGDGSRPIAPLIFGTDGELYGTTYSGGASNSGTVFKLNTDGRGYTILHSFTNSSGDGSTPASLAQRKSDGALFGMTQFGGTNGSGTLFRLNSDGGGYTVLHGFGSLNDGANPSSGLVPSSDGSVYGTTGRGGDMDLGTVFKLFSSTPVIRITAIQFNAAGAGLSLSGAAAGQLCQIQANTNLAITNGWQVIGSSIAGIDGAFQFVDTGATNYPARFYRTAKP